MEALKYQIKSFEKLPVQIWEDASNASKHIANSIALSIRRKQADGEMIILGLATGSSPIKIYEELVRLHKEEGLSFANVATFNLDEYYPMDPDAIQSYVHFMNEYLFDHIDIKQENVHIPDGTISIEDVDSFNKSYEKKIEDLGGIDIQILGIGRTGHIGFNEPGSWENSKTRLVKLDNLTRTDAAKDFIKIENVPYRAITMGISTIMKSKEVYLIAWGMHKAEIVKEAIEGPININVPATYLQKHANIKVYLDEPASEALTRNSTPWLVGMCNWTEDLVVKAVVWLSQKIDKPILKLTEEDYNEHGLSELVNEYDSSYAINIKIFNRLQHTITGWPGGKPNADDSKRPERAEPAIKRVIIFSPHPDDDVISMGGTFQRLVDQNHEVYVAYQTSGNIAVHDYDALRFLEFQRDFNESLSVNGEDLAKKYAEIQNFLEHKKTGEIDLMAVRKIKGLIRRGEARAGARFCGLDDDHILFLDMPFYETGRNRKKPISNVDIQIITDLLEQIKPHQVYVAGDLADPHGTHRVCFNAIASALDELKTKKWIKDCYVWMYRGAWHEFRINEIEMAVPISPEELLKKRKAIFMHQSQKDSAPFPGNDEREFWQRAEDRNKETAKLYDKLGLAEYEAMEAFRRYHF